MSKAGVLRAEPMVSKFPGLEERKGPVLWAAGREKRGSVHLLANDLVEAEPGQPGMELCLLLKKGTETGSQRG